MTKPRKYRCRGWTFSGVKEMLLQALNPDDAARRFLRVTNPGKGLHTINVDGTDVSVHWSSR